MGKNKKYQNLKSSFKDIRYPTMGERLDSEGSSETFGTREEASGLVRDLVSTNNHKNEKLNESGQVEARKEEEEEEEGGRGEEAEDIDDDWFSKLANNKDLVRSDDTGDGTSLLFYGLNYGEIPLLCDEDLDFKEKTMRTLRVGLKKIWRRRSATITAEDPTYKVAYLGNVLTGWAKGDGCVDKPLNTLWKNYNSSTKPDVQMKISVTQSGLKAVTKDHGLIEYWSHRITYCAVPAGLPRVFCWVYRHEGRKLKQELRCHAVLCSKESVASRMAATLKLRLTQALLEFKRDKVLRQNARLSLANSVYENPTLPRRKILLSTGSHNYKPPLERSKSAPKLMSIEESLEEEESTPKAKRKSCETEEDKGVDGQREKSALEEKCEYKLANLNFVKKLCSSIENLVESTSNYGKKLLAERKPGREHCGSLKRPEESILKKAKSEYEFGDAGGKLKGRKNVSFESGPGMEGVTLKKCVEYRKLEEDLEEEEEKEEEEQERREADGEAGGEARDQESDEGSNSLQSISSCCSDVSSLATSASDRSAEPQAGWEEEAVPPEEARRVVLHPTGEEPRGAHGEGAGEGASEEDAASDESGYAELPESRRTRQNPDRKEKDLPHHKIIKSTMLRPGRTKPCLHV